MSSSTLDRFGMFVVAIGAVTACLPAGRAHVPSLIAGTPGHAAPLEIIADSAVAYSGTMLRLRVMLRTGRGVVAVPADSVQWESSHPARAWITNGGIAALDAAGPVVVTARYQEFVAIDTLLVRTNPVATVVIDGASTRRQFIGDTITLHASAFDRHGMRIDGAVASFALAARGELDREARISADGRFVASQPGTYLVIATVGVRAAQLAVRVGLPPIADPLPMASATSAAETDPAQRTTVLPEVAMLPEVQSVAAATRRVRIAGARYEPYVGTMTSLSARVWVGDAGEPDTTAMVRWTSSDTAIAVVDGMGTVVFLRRGQVAISARHGDKSAKKRFNVLNAPAADLLVRTNADFVRAGDEVMLGTWVWALGGTRVTHGRPNYAVIDPAGNAGSRATISESGAFVARVPGVYTVIAQLGELASSATFVVHPAGGHCELHLRRWDPSCAN